MYTVSQKKGTTFFMNKSFNTQCNLTKFSTLIVSEYYRRCTYLISGIYTNFRTFLCKNCVVGYYVINHGAFAEEERVVIKFLRYNEGYSAGRLVKEFPLKKKIGKLAV